MQAIGPPLPNNHCAWFDRWSVAETADSIVVTSRSVKRRRLNPYVAGGLIGAALLAAWITYHLASPDVSALRILIAAAPAIILLVVGWSLLGRAGASSDPTRGMWELDGVGYEIRRNGLSIGLFENVTRVLIAAPAAGTESYIVVILSDGTQLGLAGRGEENGLPELTAARKLAKFLGCSVERR